MVILIHALIIITATIILQKQIVVIPSAKAAAVILVVKVILGTKMEMLRHVFEKHGGTTWNNTNPSIMIMIAIQSPV